MSKSQLNIYLLYSIIFLVYTQGFWERFTPLPAQFLLEMTVWTLALVSLKPFMTKPFVLILLTVACGLITALFTGTPIAFLKYIRFILYFYIIYSVSWNTYFSTKQFERFLAFIISMILLQGVASIYQSFILQNRIEGYVGFMSSLGGSTATAFPILVISVLTIIYLFSGKCKKKWNILMLLLFCSAILVGYSSGKRAVYFFIPIIILAAIFISKKHYPQGYARNLTRKTWHLVLIGMIIFPVFIWGIQNSKGLNYGLKGSESNLEIIEKSISYAQQYESSASKGKTIGRSGSTQNIVKRSFSSLNLFLHGMGFDANKSENALKESNIGYGIVGFTRDILTGGVLFSLLVILTYMYMIAHTDYIHPDSQSTAIKWILIFVFLLIHLFYSSDFTVSLKLTVLVSLLLCYNNSINYKHLKEQYSNYII